MRLEIALTFLVSFIYVTGFAQNTKRGFPQHVNNSHCSKITTATQSQIDNAISAYYFKLKQDYYVRAQSTTGGYYIRSGIGTGGSSNAVTHSEAHGYGMLVTVLMAGEGPLADRNGKNIFDGFYNFYDDHRSSGNYNLMSWQVMGRSSYEEFTAEGSATDGDLDIAYALLLAHYQWGSNGTINYLQKAQGIITRGIKASDINPDNYRVMVGDWVDITEPWADEYKDLSRPSDWMISHFKAFYTHTNDQFWNRVTDTAYSLYSQFTDIYNGSTPLISDFVNYEPVNNAGEWALDEFYETKHYYLNACRVPLRIGASFVHHNDQRAKSILNAIATWLVKETNGNPNSIGVGYSIPQGKSLLGDTTSMVFLAPLAVTALANPNFTDYLNKSWEVMRNHHSHYYGDFLNLLSMLLISGNWWPAAENINKQSSEKFSYKNISSSIVIKGTFRNLTVKVQEKTTLSWSLVTTSGRVIHSGKDKIDKNGTLKLAFPDLGVATYLFRARNSIGENIEKLLFAR